MEREQQNRLNMTAACLATLQSDEYKPTWFGHDPAAFAEEVTVLDGQIAAALSTAQKIQTPITGTAQLKKDAETAAEDRAIALKGALYYHFTKTGDAENLAKVHYTDDGIRKLRQQDLCTTLKTIRDCGTMALTHADATKNGVTAAKVSALSAAIVEFEGLIAAPRQKIADRSVHVRELRTQLAGCMTQLELMDQLITAFAGTPAGDALIAAWKRSRIIVDAGGGQGDDEEPENPPGGTPPTP